jgi:hypothetical protein
MKKKKKPVTKKNTLVEHLEKFKGKAGKLPEGETVLSLLGRE